jgi:glucose-1-phosphate thymidylyltransferase
MKAIILCAGYGTRLYPLTKNKAKALLPVGEKLIIDHILEKVSNIKEIDELIVTTNKKFYSSFKEWKKGHFLEDKISIFVNGSEGDHHVISALNDLAYLLEKRNFETDLLIIAGDNLFELDLRKFMDFAETNKGISIVCFEVKNKNEAKRFGVVEVKNNRIVGFEEKPEKPKTNLISSAIYFFPKDHVKLVKKVGKVADPKSNIGHLIIDLIKTENVYTFVSKGKFFDIGVLEDYKKANEVFREW